MNLEDSSLHFAQPLWILAGCAVCAGAAYLFVRFDRRRESDLAKLIHPRFRERLTAGFSPRVRIIKRVLLLLAVLLVFTAIARPHKGYEWREVKRRGIDILFAVDTSRSMLAEDLTPNRLERARLGILDFVGRLEGDRVGLIPFAGSAFALCPLTLDYDAFRESLAALDTDLIPRQGTDLASAIKEAQRLFDETGNNHRVLVLLTDGEDLQGDVITAAKAAADKGMAIHTIGVGGAEGARIPIHYQNGRTDYVRDAKGQVVETKLDEATLRKIADASGALYVPLGRGAEGLDTIYQEKLRLVPKSERDQRLERVPLERFEWPLSMAVFLLLLEFFISDRRRLKGEKLNFSVAKLGLLLTFLTISVSSSRAEDPRKVYNEGTEAYVKGDFTKATESLKASLRTPDLSLQQRSYYNLGNTLYRTGQGSMEKDTKTAIKSWEEAVKAYQDALELDPTDADALHNKGLVEKKLEELKKQQGQKDEKKPESGDEQKDDKKKDQEKKEESEDSKEEKKPAEEKDSKEGEKPDGKKSEEEKDAKDGKPDEKKEGGEKKKGDKPGEEKSAEQSKDSKKDSKKDDEKQGEKKGEMSNERAQKQEMTQEEAKQLLDALRQDKRTVVPIQPQRRGRFLTPDNSTKGKTW